MVVKQPFWKIWNSLLLLTGELRGSRTNLKNMKVSWDDEIPNLWNIKFHGSSHHQPDKVMD